MNDIIGNTEHYVSFYLGNELFAVSAAQVLEVLQLQRITKVPKAPEHFRGVINFRGEILPVIETHKKLNLPTIKDSENTVIIVFDIKLENSSMTVGAIADNVKDVFEINTNTIKDIPDSGWRHNSDYLKGMVQTQAGFVMLLDMDKVFGDEDILLKKMTLQN